MQSKRAFLICPVRSGNLDFSASLVNNLESQGWTVHWPIRDTDQDDSTGYRICSDNFQAIQNADCIFIAWDGESKGSLFDAGMAFALWQLFEKPITVLKIPPLLGKKSFQDMFKDWESRCA